MFHRSLVVASLAFGLTASACSDSAASKAEAASVAATPSPARTAGGLTRADNKYVCMVTNKVFDKEQIPITVEGRTYYGCCEMCKGRLANDEKVRSAIDPVSGNPVDKAKAVIGIRPDGSALYFENERNLQQFRS